jgi:hypothetical protein
MDGQKEKDVTLNVFFSELFPCVIFQFISGRRVGTHEDNAAFTQWVAKIEWHLGKIYSRINTMD